MFDNNIDAIIAGFYILENKEDKINYYFEPRFKKKEKDWKRSYIIKELENDFKKDINNYGFSPYIERTFELQRKDKNIMKYFHYSNYDFSEYVRKKNFLIHAKPTKNRKDISNSREKMNKSYNNISKFNLFDRAKNKNKQNLSSLNIFRNNLSTKNKPKKMLTKIVKFNRNEMLDLSKLKQLQLNNNNNNENDSSFNYNPKHYSKNFNDNYTNNYLNKVNGKIKREEESLSKTNNILLNNESYIEKYDKIINQKIQSYGKQLFKDKKLPNKRIKIRKIKIKNAPVKNLLKQSNKLYNLKVSDNSFNKNRAFSTGKAANNKNKINLNQTKNKNKDKYLYLEKLENYSGGIFKSAKKYF